MTKYIIRIFLVATDANSPLIYLSFSTAQTPGNMSIIFDKTVVIPLSLSPSEVACHPHNSLFDADVYGKMVQTKQIDKQRSSAARICALVMLLVKWPAKYWRKQWQWYCPFSVLTLPEPSVGYVGKILENKCNKCNSQWYRGVHLINWKDWARHKTTFTQQYWHNFMNTFLMKNYNWNCIQVTKEEEREKEGKIKCPNFLFLNSFSFFVIKY